MSDESHRKLLLVEGVDDQEVVRHICNRHTDLPSFQIQNMKGRPKLMAAITLEIKVSGRAALGILLDANDDLPSRWESLSDRLKKVNILIPSQMSPAGVIVDQSPNPRVGIWIMPDNKSPGEMEDFIQELIPRSDPVWPFAQAYIDGIPSDARKFKDRKETRAKVHAWLAALERPLQMGTAIKARDLDVSVELAQRFVKWLQDLFG